MRSGFANRRLDRPAVAAQENYGSAVNGDTAAFSFQSSATARDVEISFTYNNAPFRVFARVSGGKAVLFDISSSAFLIRLVSGLTESTFYATVEKTLHSQGAGLVNTSVYILGLSGFDIYVKKDGVEIIRFQDWHHTASGTVATKEALGVTRPAGTVTFLPSVALYSEPTLNFYDPRDFGMDSVATTGSISASSTTLTVASASGFSVGDHVIVEIGGEAGAGATGTAGVGGTWPALSYANAAARAADTGQANNTYAWQVDTGNVYQWATSGSTWTQQTSYYTSKAVPRALLAQITAISGTDLTLSVAATTTATNANVYLDCTPCINMLAWSIWYKFTSDLTSFVPSGARIVLPAGTFYMGGGVPMSNAAGITIEGQGATTILKSPKGTPSLMIIATGYTAATIVKNVKMVGNARDSGFGLNWATAKIPYGSDSGGMEWDTTSTDAPVTEINVPQGPAYPSGVLMSGCDNCECTGITSVDIFQKSVGASSSTDCWARNCSTTMTDGLRVYIQWCYQWADSTGGGIDTCTVTSPRLLAAFETFRSSGVTITDCTGNNGLWSSNSSGSFAFTDCTSAITVTDNDSAVSGISVNTPICNINSNITPPDASMNLGGTITNFVMTQSGYVDANNNTLQGIVVNALNPNIAITGGSFTSPDYNASSSLHGAVGIVSTGENTDVTSFTVVGKAKHETAGGASDRRNIHLTGGSGSSATSCTANEIYVNP